MRNFKFGNFKWVMLSLVSGMVATATAVVEITEDTVLQADTDWRGQGTVTIAQGVTVDLSGHTLTIDGLEGYGMIVNSHAPVGYQLLESLTATGTQYIDIGMSGASGIRADAEFSVDDANANSVVLGVEYDKIIPLWVSGGKWYAGHGNNYGGSAAYVSGTRMKVTAILKNGEQTVIGNGTTLVSTTGTGNYTSRSNNLFVFARNSDGTVLTPTRGTLYSMRIWQNATMMRDLHPARRLADNELGLVDFVTGSFYTNQAAEALIAGAAVASPSTVGATALTYSTTPTAYGACRVAIGNDSALIVSWCFPTANPRLAIGSSPGAPSPTMPIRSVLRMLQLGFNRSSPLLDSTTDSAPIPPTPAHGRAGTASSTPAPTGTRVPATQ